MAPASKLPLGEVKEAFDALSFARLRKTHAWNCSSVMRMMTVLMQKTSTFSKTCAGRMCSRWTQGERVASSEQVTHHGVTMHQATGASLKTRKNEECHAEDDRTYPDRPVVIGSEAGSN